MLYEMVVVFNGLLEDAVLAKEASALEDLLKKNGEVVKVEKWGKRKLAYPIRKKGQGDYTLFQFKCPTAFIRELEMGFRVNPNLLRFLITNKE